MTQKKIIIILLIVCLTIVVAILFLIGSLDLQDVPRDQEITKKEYEEYLDNTVFGEIIKLKDETTFFTVNSCINKYITFNSQRDYEKLYYIFSEEYRKQNDMTIDNVSDKIELYESGDMFSTKTIYEYNNNDSISTYFVYGNVIEDSYINEEPKKKDLYITVQLDKVNRTYSIILNEKENDINSISKNTDIKEIKNNKNINIYETANTIPNQMGYIYFNDYKEKLVENIDEAYELLDQEFKNIKYDKIEKFKLYIDSMDILEYITVKSCQVEIDEDKVIYTIKDQYSNIYIFTQLSIMEYTVQLDSYTVQAENFESEYKKLDNKEKGILNINKFFEMINCQDYSSAYDLLGDTFRSNNFPTESDFEKYMKNNVYRHNIVTYNGYSDEISSIYIYQIVLTDATETHTEEIKFNVTIKLLDETNFAISFSKE